MTTPPISTLLPPETLHLTSHDGFPITATHFPSYPTSRPTPATLIAPATGVQASFYSTFATFLAEQGSPVLVLDYRYIGKSFPRGVDVNDRKETLKALMEEEAKESLIDVHWQWDFNCALEWVLGRYAEKGVVVIGHSAGGHLLSTSPPSLYSRVSRALHIGVLCPWFGYTSDPTQSRAGKAFLYGETDKLGYFPSRMANLGSDLPAGIGKQWFGWMEEKTYMAAWHQEELNKYDVKCLSVAFADDLFGQGNPVMTDATLSTYPISSSTRLFFDPEQMGWQSVGHINAFHPTHKEDLKLTNGGVWTVLADWVVRGKVKAEGGERRDFNGGVDGDKSKI